MFEAIVVGLVGCMGIIAIGILTIQMVKKYKNF